MKKILLLLTVLILTSCSSQGKRPLAGKTEYQQKENARFKDASKSPLKKRDLKKFKGLAFYPVDSSYVVNATLTRTPDEPVFEMATTTDRKPLYKQYGILSFTLKGKVLKLHLFQNQENLTDEKYKDYLFLPFTDDTSGDGSYGGGRYMDVFISEINKDDTVILNFNNTYNPYCAYNDKYSCPITPRKNHLDIAIEAGVKDFKKP
ncbi:DUF1684 domain-containing protein [Flavobacteriaceae bacterium S356]|uniref:DUF1684 domain-containing protein n=1 Tax=Asprobacillus argus TaxID=3076534 RepID=A0ABU3LEX2_9FLAO|nr:DUF1684 domain-containing protein [Flavobacteriaceae bacterium S356]